MYRHRTDEILTIFRCKGFLVIQFNSVNDFNCSNLILTLPNNDSIGDNLLSFEYYKLEKKSFGKCQYLYVFAVLCMNFRCPTCANSSLLTKQ